MVNNLVFRWPKPLFFMVLEAHGIIYIIRSTKVTGHANSQCMFSLPTFPLNYPNLGKHHHTLNDWDH